MKTIRMKIKVKPEIVYVLNAVKRDADGNEISRRQSDEQHNVFTNYGVEAVFGNTTGDQMSSLSGFVGTGSSTPDVTNTLLDAYLASRYTSAGNQGTIFVDNGDGTGYLQSTWNTIFPVGTATGNISEVGSAFRTTPTNTSPLCSRALVLDGSGNPTVFEVLPDEELQLTQFSRRHISLADQSTVLTENGNNHTVTWRPWCLGTPGSTNWRFPGNFAIDGTNSWIGYATGTPTVTLVSYLSNSLPTLTGTGAATANTSQGAQSGLNTYVGGSKKRQAWMRMPTGSTSINIGYTCFNVGMLGSWQCKIDPAVAKSNLHRYTFTMEFELDNTP